MGRRENPNECFWNSINWTILQFLVQGRTVNADRELICSTERVHCKTTKADVTRHPTTINQPTNQSIPNSLFNYLSSTPLCFQGETLKRLGLSNGGLLCSLNHGLWVKLFSRWHSPVWANIPKLGTIIILTIRNKNLDDAYGDNGSWWWWFLEEVREKCHVWATPFFTLTIRKRWWCWCSVDVELLSMGNPSFFPANALRSRGCWSTWFNFPPNELHQDGPS